MRTQPFANRSPTPAEHFRLSFFGTVLRLFDHLDRAGTSPRTAEEQFPFLAAYRAELAAFGLEHLPTRDALAWWSGSLVEWEHATEIHLPLRAVRTASALCPVAEAILLTAGLIEEDPRFGLVFEEEQGVPGQHRPTLALLTAWWREEGGARVHVRKLLELELLQVVNPDAPRMQWAVQANPAVWDALRGEVAELPLPGMRYRPPHELPALTDLILADDTRAALARLPRLLKTREVRTVVIRGPRGNGRRTVLGALARSLGRGVLEVRGLRKDDSCGKLVGLLASALNAIPVLVFDLLPGETAELRQLAGFDGSVGVVLGRHGGVSGPGFDRAFTLALAIPPAAARREHWHSALGESAANLTELADAFRLSGGTIRRAAGLARRRPRSRALLRRGM